MSYAVVYSGCANCAPGTKFDVYDSLRAGVVVSEDDDDDDNYYVLNFMQTTR